MLHHYSAPMDGHRIHAVVDAINQDKAHRVLWRDDLAWRITWGLEYHGEYSEKEELGQTVFNKHHIKKMWEVFR